MKSSKIYRLFFRLAKNKFRQSEYTHNFQQTKSSDLSIWHVKHSLDNFYTFSYYPTFWESIPFTVRNIMKDTPDGYNDLDHLVTSLRILNDENLNVEQTKIFR